MLLIGFLALVGVTAPFWAVGKILDLYYSPTLSGTGPPIGASIAGFGVAVLVAAISLYVAARAMKKLRPKPGAIDPLEDSEELPE